MDDGLVPKDFVQVEGIDPFGIKTGKHLVYNNEKINPLLGILFHSVVGFFMRQARCYIFLVFLPARKRVILLIVPVIILQYFDKAIFFERAVATVINIGVNKYSYFKRIAGALLLFEESVVLDSFGDRAGSEKGMKFRVPA